MDVPAVGPSAGLGGGTSMSGPGAGGERQAGEERGSGRPVRPVRRRMRRESPRGLGGGARANARFDAAEWEAIVAAATRAGLTPTGYVATSAVAAAVGTEPPGSPVREALRELMAARTAVNVVGGLVNQIARGINAGGQPDLDQISRAIAAMRRTVARVDEAAAAVQGRIS